MSATLSWRGGRTAFRGAPGLAACLFTCSHRPPPAPPASISPGWGCRGGPILVTELDPRVAERAPAQARLGPAAVQPRRPRAPPPPRHPAKAGIQPSSPEPAPTSPARPLAPHQARHSRDRTNPRSPARSDPAPPSRRLPANHARASPGQPKPLEAEPMAEQGQRSRRGGRGSRRPRLGRGLKAAGAGPGCGESL